MFFEQLSSATEISCGQGLLCQVDIGHVFVESSQCRLSLSLLALKFSLTPGLSFLDLREVSFAFGIYGANCLPDTDACASHQGGSNCRSRAERAAMPSN